LFVSDKFRRETAKSFEGKQFWEGIMRTYRPAGAIVIILAAAILSGCWQVQSGVNAFNTIRLHEGMTRDDVIATMGKPQIRETYGKTEFLIYRTDFPIGTERADFTPVGLVNGKVTGWGRQYYAETRLKRVEANAKSKPQ
jgi:Protein of unknown function (DUF3192)